MELFALVVHGQSSGSDVAPGDVLGGPYRNRWQPRAATPRQDDLRFRQRVTGGALWVRADEWLRDRGFVHAAEATEARTNATPPALDVRI